MPILIAIYLVGLIAWWSIRKFLNQREAQRRQDAESALQRRISQDPGNMAVYEGLGDSYRSGGRLNDALGAYQKALEVAGDRPSAGVQYKIRQIQMDIDASGRKMTRSSGRGAGRAKDLINCVFCGAGNPLTSRRCEECGKELLHDTFLSALETIWTDKIQRKKMLEAIAIISIPVLCIAFAANLSLEVKGVLIISAVVVGGWVFLHSFSGDRH
ncbi:hypothetical protein CCAX7_13260 [Capsulimonas corticalis]|uniref:Uncharacterized protein n=1 Tax=Capsulimonas corticalis TaxID=2219043 RepID=A0A402D4P6_9BACT|nr:tetratricopeptide repeat protein [Capsulimonas corticalis]BDI29275.1 hypothetical protein CCAX7_13260 [Capsulimonas corticalis]